MNTWKKLRVGILGAGMIACDGHIPAYKLFPEFAEIVAICARDPQKVKLIADQYKIPQYFTEFEEMLEKCNLDLISICTPNMTHSVYIRAALEHGVNVLCEKPLSLSYTECVSLFALAEKNNCMLEACQTLRYNPEYMNTKTYIESGKLGSIIHASCNCTRRRGAPKRGAFLQTKLNGGGAFADIGVHFIDAMLWMMGNPKVLSVSGFKSSSILMNELNVDYSANEAGSYGAPSTDRVSADTLKKGDCDVEDFSSGIIRLDNNISLGFSIAWNANIPAARKMVILGEHSGVVLPEMKIYSSSEEKFLEKRIDSISRYSSFSFPGHCCLIENVINHLQNNSTLMVSPEETMNLTAALNLYYLSCNKNRECIMSDIQ